jgi:TonB family protein
LNAKPVVLPKPEYPKAAKAVGASGVVSVQITIDENGEVIEAKAVSGHPLLWAESVKAALKSKWKPVTLSGKLVKVSGTLVFNYVSNEPTQIKKVEDKTPPVEIPKSEAELKWKPVEIRVGVVNKRARKLPKPKVANLNKLEHLQIKEEQIVAVQIVIDMNGKVLESRAVSGQVSLRMACEYAARQAEFAPTLVNGGSPFNIKALLIYKFKPNGIIDTDIERDDKAVIGTPIDLVKPPPAFCNCRFGQNSGVLVEVEIDELGIVTKATAISGHPIIKLVSEKAALKSKFLPANIKSKIIIQYNFEAINKWDVKIADIKIKAVRIERK